MEAAWEVEVEDEDGAPWTQPCSNPSFDLPIATAHPTLTPQPYLLLSPSPEHERNPREAVMYPYKLSNEVVLWFGGEVPTPQP